jgi:carboxypeptidase family protein
VLTAKSTKTVESMGSEPLRAHGVLSSRAIRPMAAALALAVVGLLSACGGGDEEEEDKPKSTAGKEGGAAPAAAPAAGGGAAAGAMGTSVVSGKVSFDGPAPSNPKVKMSADAYCLKQHAGEVEIPETAVSADKGLANVFIYVKDGIKGTYPPPSTPAQIDQKGCSYTPHVFGMVAGQSLDIINSDATLHNIHAFPEKNEAFNLGMPVQGMKYTKKFDKPEVMVKIKCDVHGWMLAWCGVVTHPFFAVSGPDGTYTIKDLPAGTYTLEAWHEKLGTQTQQVTVGDKDTKTVAWTFKPAA